MRRFPIVLFSFTVLLLAACQPGIPAHHEPVLSEMAGPVLAAQPADADPDVRAAFRERLQSDGPSRQLYETYLDRLGAEGILDGLEAVWPRCHAQAHDLGKAIYVRYGALGPALRACGNRCFTGCMHGVLMEAFQAAQATNDPDGHVDLPALVPLADSICTGDPDMAVLQDPGSCAHGVGHAFMTLAAYNIPDALAACEAFTDPARRYYCITGAYMEYIFARDGGGAAGKGLLYPCDSFPYPAACARYRMRFVTEQQYAAGNDISDLARLCGNVAGALRKGCFHGLGNAHADRLLARTMTIQEACLQGTAEDRMFCIEGAVELLARYAEGRALAVCGELAGSDETACRAAAAHKFYGPGLNVTAYLVR